MIIDSGSGIYQPRRGVIGLAQIMPSFQDWETRLQKNLESSHPFGISFSNLPKCVFWNASSCFKP